MPETPKMMHELRTFEQLLQPAMRLYEEKKFEASRRKYWEIIQHKEKYQLSDSQLLVVKNNYAICLLELGRLNAAFEMLNRILTMNLDDSPHTSENKSAVYMNLGYTAWLLAKKDKSMQYLIGSLKFTREACKLNISRPERRVKILLNAALIIKSIIDKKDEYNTSSLEDSHRIFVEICQGLPDIKKFIEEAKNIDPSNPSVKKIEAFINKEKRFDSIPVEELIYKLVIED